MENIVISLGGSLIVPDSVDTEFLRDFRQVILDSQKRFVIICGGGTVCRDYQTAARKITSVSDEDCDWIGIMSTKLNAELVRAIFGKHAHEKVIEPLDDFDTDKKVIVGAGFQPGWSSDMASVLLAEKFKAKTLINMSNIDMVYDKDPNKFDDARPVRELSWDEYLLLVGTEWRPGRSTPFDPISAKKAKELGISVVIFSSLFNLKNFLEKKGFTGTIIK